MSKLLNFISVVLYFYLSAEAYSQVKDGYACVSPDKQWTITIKDSFALVGKDFGTPQELLILPKVLNVIWSDDSKLILIVQHIARGTIGGILDQKDNQWALKQVEPPVKFRCVYSILHAKFNYPKILLTYRVSRIDNSPACYLCDFIYDVSDGTTSEVHLKLISNKDNLGDVFSK